MQQFLIKNHHKIDGKFSRQRCLDPYPVLKKNMDPDPVCPERLDPDQLVLRGWIRIRSIPDRIRHLGGGIR